MILQAHEFKPHIGLRTVSVEPDWAFLSPSLSWNKEINLKKNSPQTRGYILRFGVKLRLCFHFHECVCVRMHLRVHIPLGIFLEELVVKNRIQITVVFMSANYLTLFPSKGGAKLLSLCVLYRLTCL